ncbi:hypothetical protein [Novimethylophilus kurashikiensis]|uniref:hypothetical protein n=1 Tax=Novimethylophilus kurashikiensis TaxID=1825523 RepID=UPI0011B2560E|nr:hypothetical protein [Novimethylophilus kurashikiensis]
MEEWELLDENPDRPPDLAAASATTPTDSAKAVINANALTAYLLFIMKPLHTGELELYQKEALMST